ncbi:negative regulation of protein localization to cell cortex [Branchiostoma belcheri]|nr:negative regulation of protein localization to cell cortex [Branchiostoma belcheri]
MVDVEMPLFSAPFVPSGSGDLPEAFVASLRALWDILDDGNCGLVSLGDIERHWRQDGTELRGVVECLRKVAPHDKMLSFDIFCKGLRIALSGPDCKYPLAELTFTNCKPFHNTDKGQGQVVSAHPRTPQPVRSLSASALLNQDKKTLHNSNTGKTAILNSNQDKLGLLNSDRVKTGTHSSQDKVGIQDSRSHRRTQRAFQSVPDLSTQSNPSKQVVRINKPKSEKGRIMDKLRLWQNETLAFLSGDMDRSSRGSADGTSSSSTDNTGPSLSPPGFSPKQKRKEFRRHTLANGLDYNVLKRMKQLEQEKDILLQGLETVERAHDWYHSQILAVQDKQKYLDAQSPSSKLLDASQVCINRLSAQVQEVNHHLNTLLQDTGDKGGLSVNMDLLTSHSDRVVSPTVKTSDKCGHIQELSDKTEKIRKLEEEKSLLIRQVFEARSQIQKMQNPSRDSTFI